MLTNQVDKLYLTTQQLELMNEWCLPVHNQVDNLLQLVLCRPRYCPGNPIADQPINPTQKVPGKLSSIFYSVMPVPLRKLVGETEACSSRAYHIARASFMTDGQKKRFQTCKKQYFQKLKVRLNAIGFSRVSKISPSHSFCNFNHVLVQWFSTGYRDTRKIVSWVLPAIPFNGRQTYISIQGCNQIHIFILLTKGATWQKRL